jgi:hypothetical protein
VGGKWVEILKELAPAITRVGFLFNPTTAPGGGSYFLRRFEAAAPSFQVQPIAIPVENEADIERALVSLGAGGKRAYSSTPTSSPPATAPPSSRRRRATACPPRQCPTEPGLAFLGRQKCSHGRPLRPPDWYPSGSGRRLGRRHPAVSGFGKAIETERDKP